MIEIFCYITFFNVCVNTIVTLGGFGDKNKTKVDNLYRVILFYAPLILCLSYLIWWKK